MQWQWLDCFSLIHDMPAVRTIVSLRMTNNQSTGEPPLQMKNAEAAPVSVSASACIFLLGSRVLCYVAVTHLPTTYTSSKDVSEILKNTLFGEGTYLLAPSPW